LFWNVDHTFDPTNTEVVGDKTLVYWLHGGLHLHGTPAGDTKKRTNTGANLLATFAADGRVPLFVSEGTSKQKRSSIRRSEYLEHAYQTLANTGGNLVVVGQAFGQPDKHLVDAMLRTPEREIAYGIYAATLQNSDLQRAEIANLFPNASLHFFDSRTHELGQPALLVP
jgi:Domain of unknown function (DUF4917)